MLNAALIRSVLESRRYLQENPRANPHCENRSADATRGRYGAGATSRSVMRDNERHLLLVRAAYHGGDHDQ